MHSLARHPWITFTVLRLLLFIVPLVIAAALGANLALAAILAAVVSLSLSVIFLPRLRTAMAADIATRTGRKPAPSSDEIAEDAVLDEAAGTGSTDDAIVEAAPAESQASANTAAKPTP